MKKPLLFFSSLFALASCGRAPTSSVSSLSSLEPSSSSASAEATITVSFVDAVGRTITIRPGSFKRVICIGAGALRAYSYVGDVKLLAGVEDIDNETLANRPKMFDNVARPYVMANAEIFKALPSCGVGGPNAQAAEAEKILSCNPDIVFSEYEDADKSEALSKQLGCPVVTLSMSNDAKFKASLANIGLCMGTMKRAKELATYYDSAWKEIEEKTADVSAQEQKKTYICGLGQWGTTNQFMTAQNYAPFNRAHIQNVISGLAKDGIQAIDEEKFTALAPEMEVMVFDAAAIKNIKGKNFDFSICKAFQTGDVYLQMAYNAYYTNFEISLISGYYLASISYPSRFASFDIEAKANEITKMFNGVELYDQIKAKPQSYGGYQKIENPTQFFA